MTTIRNTPGGRYIDKHSVIIGGMKTAISLEPVFWQELKRIHYERKGREPTLTLSNLLTEIDSTRGRANLSSAVRLYVLRDFMRRIDHVSIASAAHAPHPHSDAAGHAAAAPCATEEPRRILAEAE